MSAPAPTAEPASRSLWTHHVTHSDLPRGPRLAGLALATRATSAGAAHVSIPDVAALAGVTAPTARRALEALHTAGYVQPRPERPFTGPAAPRTAWRLTLPIPASAELGRTA